MDENLTVQEILELDSSVYLSVGAVQLQKILTTMKHYKDQAESTQELLTTINQANTQLKHTVSTLEKQIAKQAKQLDEAKVNRTSLGKQIAGIPKLRADLTQQTLRNTTLVDEIAVLRGKTVSIRCIASIDLEDL